MGTVRRFYSEAFRLAPFGTLWQTSTRKARRKDRELSSLCSDDPKLYLEEAVLERKLPDIDLQVLLELPAGLDYNEWLASHTIAFFDHINLIYGTISEFCTMSGCPEMTGPCLRCANLTVGERSLLIDLVVSHFDIVENKQTDAVTISKKNQTWKVLTAQFNTHSGLMNRTKENLKAAWENMKRLARRMDRMERECTVGGGPLKKRKEDPLLEKVLLLIQPTAGGYSVDYDPGESQGDDMGMEMPEVETTMDEGSMDNVELDDTKNMFPDEMQEYMDNPVEARNTIQNTPNIMRAPISDCLRVSDGLEPVGETPLQRAKIEAVNRQYHMALQERNEVKEINKVKLEIEKEKLKQEKIRTKLLFLDLKRKKGPHRIIL